VAKYSLLVKPSASKEIENGGFKSDRRPRKNVPVTTIVTVCAKETIDLSI